MENETVTYKIEYVPNFGNNGTYDYNTEENTWIGKNGASNTSLITINDVTIVDSATIENAGYHAFTDAQIQLLVTEVNN